MINNLCEYVEVQKFSDNNLEILINQINDYIPNVTYESVKEQSVNKFSYIQGMNMVMQNLGKLYANIESQPFSGSKIFALNCTVNKKVLTDFLKTVKNDLDIDYKIFNGGKLDIPLSKKIIENISKNYCESNIDFEYYMLGVKRIVDVISYAYYAPLTGPFKGIIKRESKEMVIDISEKLSNL